MSWVSHSTFSAGTALAFSAILEVESQVPQFTESYLENYFDDFEFFNPGCKDKRIREINMRTKFCMQCKGFESCKMHPHYWLEGEAHRLQENEKLAVEEASRPKPAAVAAEEDEE